MAGGRRGQQATSNEQVEELAAEVGELRKTVAQLSKTLLESMLVRDDSEQGAYVLKLSEQMVGAITELVDKKLETTHQVTESAAMIGSSNRNNEYIFGTVKGPSDLLVPSNKKYVTT